MKILNQSKLERGYKPKHKFIQRDVRKWNKLRCKPMYRKLSDNTWIEIKDIKESS
jgi:hypothetical protein